MSLVRANRRYTSAHNSLIDIEESKQENKHYKNEKGEYIEPVPEEKGDQSFNFTDGSYVSLSDLGGDK